MQNLEISPFIFGKLAEPSEFVNREGDIKRLQLNFESGINTILISPRRWGKSSLVRKTGSLYEGRRNIKVCYVDLFNVRTEQDFCKVFASAVIKGCYGRAGEWVHTVSKFFKTITPKFSVPVSDQNSIDLELEFTNYEKERETILSLPEKIAKEKNIRVVVCIDEFQNIEQFDDPVGFQKILRASWQLQRQTAYCLYGSKRSMLSQLFQDSSMPFYKFGDVMYLEKIETEHFAAFIMHAFKKTKRKIDKKFAEQICTLMKRHSYYVQQYAHFVWSKTAKGKEVTEKIMKTALDEIININKNLFQREFEGLSAVQINLMRAFKDGVKKNFSKNEIIRKYNLGSSSAATQSLAALEKKDIIDRFTGENEFVDPLFEIWLQEVF